MELKQGVSASPLLVLSTLRGNVVKRPLFFGLWTCVLLWHMTVVIHSYPGCDSYCLLCQLLSVTVHSNATAPWLSFLGNLLYVFLVLCLYYHWFLPTRCQECPLLPSCDKADHLQMLSKNLPWSETTPFEPVVSGSFQPFMRLNMEVFVPCFTSWPIASNRDATPFASSKQLEP